jgi:hypothetical protein
MRVLIAQESSGVIRRAFAARGHFAVSVDLLPADDGNKLWGSGDYAAIRGQGVHYQGDIMDFIFGDAGGLMDAGFDLMIAHPECTYLCNSGVRWLYINGRKENGQDLERWRKADEAADHYNRLGEAPIDRICRENPVMHNYALGRCGHATQFVQPWQHGHGEIKATGLRLKNLPLLKPTKIVDGRTPRVHHASPGPDRWKERSRTLTGIAAAMADQWGNL